jgi:hypothetical protein
MLARAALLGLAFLIVQVRNEEWQSWLFLGVFAALGTWIIADSHRKRRKTARRR